MKFQKVTQIVINNVKAFLQPFASKTLIKAVEFLLKPCCDLTATAEAACVDTDIYDVTITTDSPIGFLGKGVATVVINGVSFTGVVTEPNTIFLEGIEVTPATEDLNVTLFLPTNTNGSVGVFKTITVADVVFASCV
jgi:hypothetical protein